jgi:hypothetical protein
VSLLENYGYWDYSILIHLNPASCHILCPLTHTGVLDTQDPGLVSMHTSPHDNILQHTPAGIRCHCIVEAGL